MKDEVEDVTRDTFEAYMDAPSDGTFNAYYVARDVFRLIGFIEGMQAAIRLTVENGKE